MNAAKLSVIATNHAGVMFEIVIFENKRNNYINDKNVRLAQPEGDINCNCKYIVNILCP